MRLTMLGTGSASVKNCFNTCFIFSENGSHFLVDAGGGNQILKILDEQYIYYPRPHRPYTGRCMACAYDWPGNKL